MAITYAQGMTYELARELISSQIGHVSHEIAIEEKKANPAQARISELEAKIVEFGRERERLSPDDDASVRDVIQRYCRDSKQARSILDTLQSLDEFR